MTANIADAGNSSDQDELIVAAKRGFARLNRSTGKLNYLREVWTEEDGPGRVEL